MDGALMSGFGERMAASARWYVLEVGSTRTAVRNLAREEIEAWSPLCETIRHYKPRGYRTEITSTWRGPLFPGYVLARFSVRMPWRWITELNGVLSVLMVDGRPWPIEDAFIDWLRHEIEFDGGALRIDDLGKRRKVNKRGAQLYCRGQRLRVTGGSFESCEGLYVGDAKARVTLLLDMLGRTVPVVLPEALVTPA
jgi:transcription antitermination factor NusG